MKKKNLKKPASRNPLVRVLREQGFHQRIVHREKPRDYKPEINDWDRTKSERYLYSCARV
jgi:hypothetical protein